MLHSSYSSVYSMLNHKMQIQTPIKQKGTTQHEIFRSANGKYFIILDECWFTKRLGRPKDKQAVLFMVIGFVEILKYLLLIYQDILCNHLSTINVIFSGFCKTQQVSLKKPTCGHCGLAWIIDRSLRQQILLFSSIKIS